MQPKKKEQASATESLKRTRRAQELLVKGYSSREVQQSLSKEFSIAARQCNNYIAKARQAFIEENPENRTQLKAQIQSMYLDLYKKSYAKDCLKQCREILDSLSKIAGLHEPSEDSPQTIKITYSKGE